MAKKKRKKRSAARTGAVTSAPGRSAHDAGRIAPVDETEHISDRRLRKERARRERERRLRAYRRRLRLRRAVRWGTPLAILAAVSTVFVVRNIQESERAALAAEAAECGELSTEPDVSARHTPPFVEGEVGIPASIGNHSSPLPPEPAVYDRPVPEESAVHNLEHGYVLIHYRDAGDDPLGAAGVSRLKALVSGEDKVIMAPYEGLASGLALVAWRQVQLCDPPGADEAEAVAEHFIDEFRSGGLAPEPGAQ